MCQSSLANAMLSFNKSSHRLGNPYFKFVFLLFWSYSVFSFCFSTIRQRGFHVGRGSNSEMITPESDPIQFWGTECVALAIATAFTIYGFAFLFWYWRHREAWHRLQSRERKSETLQALEHKSFRLTARK
jgi:hypothetical protein